MIFEGDEAPQFELPAVEAGDHRRVALDEYVGEDVVVLAFYPGDFNPACDEESDLDELDLFTMQKDVSVLGIGADTLSSHEAFAAEYDLHIPLLADTRREVAAEYGVTFEGELGQALIERAVFVVDHDGVVQYVWSTREPTTLPDVDAIKDAIADTGGDGTAFARYRVGHAHYTEGRRAFTSAMGSYQNSEWMISQSDFKRSQEEFEEAADHFDSAVRFVDDDDLATYYEHAEEKATALWQAAEWLSESASEYSSGAGVEGQQLRDDAERPLETARDIGEPIDPDDWPPDLDAADDTRSILPQDDDAEAELAVDIDEAATGGAEADAPTLEDAAESDEATDQTEGDEEIDDEELEEIEAELAANRPDDPRDEAIEETPTSMVDAPPGTDEAGEGDDDGTVEGEIDEDDLAELEADLEASQSAAEAAQAKEDADDGSETEADDVGDDETGDEADGAATDPFEDGSATTETKSSSEASAGDPTPDTSSSLEPDDSDVPPPGSGSLEPGRGSSGDGSALDDDGGEALSSDDGAGALGDTGDGSASLDDEADEPESLDETDELEEPDGATDEDMAAIPTEEELAAEDEDDATEGEDDADGERY